MKYSDRFKKTLAKVQKVGRAKFLALGIESIDQAEEYLGYYSAHLIPKHNLYIA